MAQDLLAREPRIAGQGDTRVGAQKNLVGYFSSKNIPKPMETKPPTGFNIYLNFKL